MQSAVSRVPVYPDSFVEGISVIHESTEEQFSAPEVATHFVPLVYGSKELKALEKGDVIWIARELSPDVQGFTKWVVRHIVRIEDEVRIYYGEGFLKTIGPGSSASTAYVVHNENSLLELVRTFGSRAIGMRFS